MRLKYISVAVAAISFSSLASAAVVVQAEGGQIRFLSETPVQPGQTVEVELVADSGYQLPTSVAGTCPAGTLEGSIYTSGVITQGCSLEVSFQPKANELEPLQGFQLSLRVPAARLTVEEGNTEVETETALIGGLGLNYVGNFGDSTVGYRVVSGAHFGNWQDYAYVETDLGADLRFLTHQRFRPYVGARLGKAFVLGTEIDSLVDVIQEIPQTFSEQWTVAGQAGFTVSLAEQGFWSKSEFETFGRYAVGQGSAPSGRELTNAYELGYAINIGF